MSLAASPLVQFDDLPMLHTWIHFFEAYHNHMARFRGKNVVFMEVGVQSGGKIPMLRHYFGPGFKYVGIDINPSTKMFESAEWVHIEIGDSSDPAFLAQIKLKYPHVDIFLDDGGHTMTQQVTAMREMLPHVQSEGVYICEDLATSFSPSFGGVEGGHAGNPDFLQKTMIGLVHRSMDWFMAMFSSSDKHGMGPTRLSEIPEDAYQESWWKIIPQQVKHIHYYNQLVVFEKGVTHAPVSAKTVGRSIKVSDSGTHAPVDWSLVMRKVEHILQGWDTPR